tara:strand:- start:2164 stop:2367 length:204 start_codon:yes stop_codon:yes gene_type:complete
MATDEERKRYKEQRTRQVVSGNYGKGDRPRTDVFSTKYQLGMRLFELERGTPEYEETLKAWRKAKGD